MMTGSAVVLRVVVAIVVAISAEGSEVWQTETSKESLHPSSHAPFENLVTPTWAEAFHSRNSEHTRVDILAASQDTKPISTLASSIGEPPTYKGIASTPTSTPIATSEVFYPPAKIPTAQSSFAAATHVVNATHLYPVAETYIQRAESAFHSLDVAHSQSLENSFWFTVSSETEIGSTQFHGHGTIFDSTATLVLNHSTPLEGHSSTKAGHITPSQTAKSTIASTKAFTTHSTPPPKSVTDKPPSSSTSSKPTTPAPKTPVQSSAAALTSGAKIAIGVIVTLCILAAIVGAVVLYRRFNITHRSLKSFLTSGVRYKTYKNATYKDDEVVGEVGIVSELT